MRLRGLPASEGSIFSHLLLSHFADSRRMRIGYKVPGASLVCLSMSAPESPVKGASRNCPSTWRVGPERRGESLPIHETLHRVWRFCQFRLGLVWSAYLSTEPSS